MAVEQEVVKYVSHERVQQRTVEHAPVPQILKETVEVIRMIPHEREQRTVEHVRVRQTSEETVEPVPLMVEKNVDVVRLVPQEREQEYPRALLVRWVQHLLQELDEGEHGLCGLPMRLSEFQMDVVLNWLVWKNCTGFSTRDELAE